MSKRNKGNNVAVLDTQKKYPVLAVRDIVVFPSTVIPLHVGRQLSLSAIDRAMKADGFLVCISQKNADIEEISSKDLYRFGTVVKVLQAVKLPGGNMKILIEGVSRVNVTKLEKSKTKGIVSTVDFVSHEKLTAAMNESLMRLLQDKFAQYLRFSEQIALDVVANLATVTGLSDYADLIAAHLPIPTEIKQSLLQNLDLEKRVKRLLVALEQETQWQNKEKEMLDKVKNEINDDQQSYYIRKKMKIFEEELKNMGEAQSSDVAEYEKKIKTLQLPKDDQERLLSEVNKLKNMPEMSAESTVVRNHLDAVLALPWNIVDKVNKDLAEASRLLNKRHYGLKEVKERILESLAVSLRVTKNKAPIICLEGPPGVGKTSLGQSIAKAMGRSFVRIALGGVRDESEIRGHRRTYIGALPGQIVRALTKAKTMNPVIMLDEIDKMGMDFRGDPASALLEVLDPEQNKAFNDHYIEMDLDLSKVLFITTANDTSQIPEALYDRLEMISLSGYTEEEKKQIAEKHLMKKCFEDNGVSKKELRFTEAALLQIIRVYTREAGVRELERIISKVCRKVVKAQSLAKKKKIAEIVIDKKDLAKYLGAAIFSEKDIHKKAKIGVVNGLAWTSAGGQVLNIEAAILPGKGELVYTGSLGDVMQESIKIAHSVIRGVAKKFRVKEGLFSEKDYHIHVPEGATPKDGPSAGIGMATALLSVAAKKKVKHNLAMTGELTLSGEVLPIGGLKEKILAAIRSGANEVVIPKGNQKDLNVFKKDISGKINVHLVSDISEVFKHAFVQ